MIRRAAHLAILLATVLSAAGPARAQVIRKDLPEAFKGVDIVPKLGSQAPLDLEFTDGAGQRVKLAQFFRPGRPVVLVLAYYRCPMTCPLVLQKLQEGLNGIPYIVGEDFNCLVISFDPTEKPQTAAEQKALYLTGYTKGVTPVIKRGWEFMVSPDSAASTLASSVGFSYKFVPESGQYSHPAALIVLTPEGKVARYISGIDYTPQDLRAALLEASEGKIAKTMGDFFVHLCYRYDVSSGRYTLAAFRVMQIGGILTALTLATLITALRAHERLKRFRRAAAAQKTERTPGPVGSLLGQAR